jgi:hydroxyacylglutathione hydrolase
MRYMWTYKHAGFFVHQFPALRDNYIYLVDKPESGVLMAIDPAEGEQVVAWCRQRGRRITHVLNTHHHWDHVGANLELKASYDCQIIGPALETDRIPGIDGKATEEEAIRLDALKIRTLLVPGHTRGHVAYLLEDALFCGDTLFGAGCGRLFEGSPEQMWQSLNRIIRLPGHTRFYCAHEYTLDNLRFAQSVDPDNTALQKRLCEVERLRAEGLPTIPGTLDEELATNPFLRPLDESFRTDYATRHNIMDDPVRVFAHIRKAKDLW